MKSSIKISNNGNTIRATGAAANALFNALSNPQPDKVKPRPFNGALAHFTDRIKPWTLADESAMSRIDVELAALNAIAESADRASSLLDQIYAEDHIEPKTLKTLREALTNLAAVRKEGK